MTVSVVEPSFASAFSEDSPEEVVEGSACVPDEGSIEDAAVTAVVFSMEESSSARAPSTAEDSVAASVEGAEAAASGDSEGSVPVTVMVSSISVAA